MVLRALGPIGLLALAACVANEEIPVPGITALMPGHGAPGSTVTVIGKYLCQQPPRDDPNLPCTHIGTVTFDVTSANVMSYTDTMARVEVPAVSPGRFDVIVSILGRSSNRMPFVVD